MIITIFCDGHCANAKLFLTYTEEACGLIFQVHNEKSFYPFSECFHFIPVENTRKPKVYLLVFPGVLKWKHRPKMF